MTAKKETLTPEEMMEQASQRIAQMEMEAQRRIEAKIKEAENKEAAAAKVLENARLTAAGIPQAPKQTLDKELSEAAKLSLQARMERQFGGDDMTSVAIPLDMEGKSTLMSVLVNGWEYNFQRGMVYSIPKAMLPLIMGSVYVESPELTKNKM
jgi:hypothetical protein